jgi:hypothetical protein
MSRAFASKFRKSKARSFPTQGQQQATPGGKVHLNSERYDTVETEKG